MAHRTPHTAHRSFLILLLMGLFFSPYSGYSQSALFSIINPPTILNSSQTKMLNKVNSDAHIGDVKFVQFSTPASIGTNGSISLSIPSVNNGASLSFEIKNAIFDDATHFSIQASSSSGYVNLYFTPEGTGGTIDLINRLFFIAPLGSNKGLLSEKNMGEASSSICGNVNKLESATKSYCEGDCGSSVLDVLILRTAAANTWLTTTYGAFAEWFLYVESNNINLALVNSGITNKWVRVRSVNFTPDFTFSTSTLPIDRLLNDDISLSNSIAALSLLIGYKADIGVLLTLNGYGSFSGISNSLDPESNNKFCIVEVPVIGSIRYTFAHEVAHQFGCLHDNDTADGACPHGKRLDNGRNTILAGTANNTRIPYFSNPDVSFAGESTGETGLRNNTQQIRASFCQSANNNPDPQFISIGRTGLICPLETVTFNSNIVEGNFIGLNGLPATSGATPPYQYEWRKSNNVSFTNNELLGTTQNIQMTIPAFCSGFYLKLTVTDATSHVFTAIKYFPCANSILCFQGGISGERATKEQEEKPTSYQALPNPAHDEVKIIGSETESIIGIQCFNLGGQEQAIDYRTTHEVGQIVISTSTLLPGMYLIKVNDGKKYEVLKIVIQ